VVRSGGSDRRRLDHIGVVKESGLLDTSMPALYTCLLAALLGGMAMLNHQIRDYSAAGTIASSETSTRMFAK